MTGQCAIPVVNNQFLGLGGNAQTVATMIFVPSVIMEINIIYGIDFSVLLHQEVKELYWSLDGKVKR